MKYIYNKCDEVSFSKLDSNFTFSVASALILIQDMMTEYFGNIGSDNVRLRRENNAIWIVSKTKVKFYKYPLWKEKLKVTTDTVKVKPIRVELETKCLDENDELIFIAKQEVCPIDVETRKLRKIDTINYPKDMEASEMIFNEEHQKLNEEFNEENKIYTQKVLFSDIDANVHANNVAYIKYALNTFNSDFFIENQLKDIDIAYLHECKEGEELSIYRKQKEKEFYFLIKAGNCEVMRAKMSF